MSDYQRMLHQIAELRRQMGQMLRVGTVHEVKGDKLRMNLGNDRDGKPVLSPWLHTGNHRGGARERRFFNPPKQDGSQAGGSGGSGSGGSGGGAGGQGQQSQGGGQNLMMFCPGGDPRQAVLLPYGPNDNNKPPAHANKSGKDEEVYQLEDLRVSKGKDGYDIWLEKEEEQQGGSSGGSQGGQESKERNTGGEKARVKLRLHDSGGITARVGSGSSAVRFSTHKEGVKMKYGNSRWAVISKSGNIVSHPWVLGKDPLQDDNK